MRIQIFAHSFESDVTEEELFFFFFLEKVRELNADNDVDGLLYNFLCPITFQNRRLLKPLITEKMLTVFTPSMWAECQSDCLATFRLLPNGIIELLKRYQIETSGKKCRTWTKQHCGQNQWLPNDAERLSG